MISWGIKYLETHKTNQLVHIYYFVFGDGKTDFVPFSLVFKRFIKAQTSKKNERTKTHERQ